MTKHTLSVLVENKPGVLARVSGLFSRRGFNIDSLAVGETENPDVSRITIVVNADSSPAGAGDQAAQQAGQRPEDRRAGPACSRCSASCCWSRCGPTGRSGRRCWRRSSCSAPGSIDVAPDTLTIEATGTADKLDALLRDLEPYGIKEMVQSGLVAIGRGSRSITTGPALRAA